MSAPLHNAEAAAALFAGLVSAGVRTVVICPGSRSTPLALAAVAHPDLECRVAVDERAAGFLALGLARGSRRPAALLCTSGSAALHFAPAVAEAAATHAGLVVLTADRPAELHGVGAAQTFDQRRLFGRSAAFERDLPAPDGATPTRTWHLAGLDAGRAASEGHVAHLNLAFREPLWSPTLAPVPTAALGPSLPRPVSLPAPSVVAAWARRLAEHSRGVIHVGPHADHDPALGAAVRRLGLKLGWPVFAEAASGVRAGAPPSAVISASEALARSPRFVAAHPPSALLRLGRAPHSRALNDWLTGSRPVLAVGIDAWGDRHDPEHHLHEIWQADPSVLVAALAENLPVPSGKSEWFEAFALAERRARRQLDADAAAGFWAGTVSSVLGATLGEISAERPGGVLHVASSMAWRDLDAFLPAHPEQRFQVTASRGLNGIDGTVSTAVGLALTRAPAPSAALLGDLACQHDLGGLALAGALQPPLTLVVVHNGGGGIFDHLAIAAHPAHARLFRTPQPQVDLVAAAGALGVRAVAVHTAAALKGALAEALSRPGVDVIVAHIDPADDLARHRAAWAAATEVIQ